MHTSFLTTATQIQLANYITNTGCRFEWQFTAGAIWSSPYNQTAQWHVSQGYQIRIALTEYGLPSHLSPRNPANTPAEVITEGGYRAWTVMEYENLPIRTSGPMLVECWEDSNWDDTGWEGSLGHRTYRVPVSVQLPDWEERSQPPAKDEPEGAVIDDRPATYETGREDGRSEMLEAFESAPQPTFTMPQPITEPMPPLAEGCRRYYTRWGKAWECIGEHRDSFDTHFIDLRNLPSPEDVNRTAFEKWWSGVQPKAGRHKTESFEAWNAALDSLNA